MNLQSAFATEILVALGRAGHSLTVTDLKHAVGPCRGADLTDVLSRLSGAGYVDTSGTRFRLHKSCSEISVFDVDALFYTDDRIGDDITLSELEEAFSDVSIQDLMDLDRREGITQQAVNSLSGFITKIERRSGEQWPDVCRIGSYHCSL